MPWPDWQKRHDEHRQPRRRVDYSRPGFVRPPDPVPDEPGEAVRGPSDVAGQAGG